MGRRIFSDEHEMLRKSIRAFVEKEVTPHVREWEDAGRIPRSLWRRLGELGFLGLEFPTEHGGGGGDFLSSVVLGEEMARCRSGGVAFSVLVHTDMSSPWLTRFGTEAQKRRYLPRIVAGELVCALAITEPGTGSDMAALSTRAERRGAHYVLTGGKLFITNGTCGPNTHATILGTAAVTRSTGTTNESLTVDVDDWSADRQLRIRVATATTPDGGGELRVLNDSGDWQRVQSWGPDDNLDVDGFARIVLT